MYLKLLKEIVSATIVVLREAVKEKVVQKNDENYSPMVLLLLSYLAWKHLRLAYIAHPSTFSALGRFSFVCV